MKFTWLKKFLKKEKNFIGKKAKLNIPASFDFPELRNKELKILSVDKEGMCLVEVDGEEFPHKIGLKGELVLM